jgi:hypothetical protein
MRCDARARHRMHSRTYRERLHLFDDGVSLRGREDDRRARRLRRASDRFLRRRIRDARRSVSLGVWVKSPSRHPLSNAPRARAPRIAPRARARVPQNFPHARPRARHPRLRRPTRAHRAETLARARDEDPRDVTAVRASPSILRTFVPVANDVRTLETLVANAGEATTRAAVAEIVKDIV